MQLPSLKLARPGLQARLAWIEENGIAYSNGSNLPSMYYSNDDLL